LVTLSLGGNQVDELIHESIETELACNRGINDLILPMIKDHGSGIKNHCLSLAGKGISNLDFLAKFIRENPHITGMNIEMDEFHEHEVAKVAKELEGNTGKAEYTYYIGINQFTMRGNKKRKKNVEVDSDISNKYKY
jgi:hypothetical protein